MSCRRWRRLTPNVVNLTGDLESYPIGASNRIFMNILPNLIRRTPSYALKRLIWSLVRRRVFPYEITTSRGWHLHGNTIDWIQRNLYYFGIWEPNLSAWIERRLSRGDTFVDVGANIGYFTLLAVSCVGPTGRVIAIEPMPEIYQHLSEHVQANTSGNVRLVNQAAVGPDESGPVALYWGGDENAGSTGMIQRHQNARSVTVTGQSLSKILTNAEIQCARIIKIDVEGVELRALRGLNLESDRFSKALEVVVEVSLGDSEALISYMKSLGFIPYILPEDYGFRRYVSRAAAITPPQRLVGSLTAMHNVVFSRIDAVTLE